jgi:hypothetical protein
VYGNENGAPMDEKFKADMAACFKICKVVDQEFEDKSIEFRLAVMAERIGHERGDEHHVGHDIAIHYCMALAKDLDLKFDAVAETLKVKMELPDPEAKVTRMPHDVAVHYYQLAFYDPMAKANIYIGFHLDGQNTTVEDWHEEFLSMINKVISDRRHVIMYDRHPDCSANGCQYAAEHGAEGSCAGRCYWITMAPV